MDELVAERERSEAQSAEDRLAWVALMSAPQVGHLRAVRAMAKLPRARSLFDANLTQLEALGLPAAAARFVAEGKAKSVATEEVERVLQEGGDFVTYADAAFPERLREIYDAPAVLWFRGDVSALARPGIGVVGTRHPSVYGQTMAQLLSRDLAARGLTIISGMARGVDTFAHKGALEAKGKTIAVWGTGIDVIYPKENKRLAEEILQQGGTILSEYSLGTFPAPQNFPVRNRIISGMSVGVLVVEAAENSGTRVTARCALDQGRDVYAVPGNVTNKGAWGPNLLIKQGARLTATWEDVWEDLPTQIRFQLEESLAGHPPAVAGGEQALFPEIANEPMPEPQQQVYAQLRLDESVQLDELIEALDGILEAPDIFNALFELEIAGKVKQLPGKYYLRSF